MKVADVAGLVGIAGSTVRAWSMGEYKRYLSPTAQGGSGSTRNFTELDARILALIYTRKTSGAAAQDIHAELQALQGDDWNDLPPLSATVGNVASVPVVPAAAAEMALSAHTQALLREIADLRQRIDTLEGKNDTLQTTVSDLRAKLARAETLVELYESGRLKPRE
jgi:DNA-binding transcriptional MerR regulator